MISKFFKLPWSKKPAIKDQPTTINKKTEAAKTKQAEKPARELIDQVINLDSFNNVDELLENLLKHTPNQRHTALTSLGDETLLRQIGKQSEKLDKRSNQIVREKLKTFRENEQSQRELEEKIEKLCIRLESLSRQQYNALFDSELFHLKQSWQHLLKDVQSGFSVLIARGESALTHCQTIKITTENALEEARLADQREAEIQAEEQSRAMAESASESLVTNTVAAETTVTDKPSALLEEIQAAKQAIAAEKQKLREEKQQQFAAQLENDLPKLEQAIEDRNVKKSRELANQLQNVIRQLEPKYANRFSGKLQLLQNQLKELQDWQEFATLPKLEALCASMEQLITTSLPAPQKATAIRELQEQWRSMKLPQSTTAQELWTRFKQASDTAYAPCAEYFANEKTTRAFNLAQRQTICESLETFYRHNWGTEESAQNINWKAVGQIITTAKQEFHKFHPVERSDEKPIRERFDKAMNLLNTQLHDEYQRNESQKQALIDQVSELLNSEDIQKAIDTTRTAQQQWKTIGITRRAQDQKLWEAFQQSCNAVFEKRQQSRQQEQQKQLDLLASAESLCEQIKALGDLADAELSQSKEKFNSLQDQFHTLGDLGDKQRARISRKFSDACDYYKKQVTGIAQREQQRQLQTLECMAALCQQLEYKPDAETIDRLINEWEASDLNSNYLALLQPRYQNAVAIARGETGIDYSANEEQLRQLCIELEFLTGSDTPEEDRQRRRDYQMQALAKNFGKGAINHHQQVEKLLMNWFTIGAAAPAIQAGLQTRFDALRKHSKT